MLRVSLPALWPPSLSSAAPQVECLHQGSSYLLGPFGSYNECLHVVDVLNSAGVLGGVGVPSLLLPPASLPACPRARPPACVPTPPCTLLHH